MLARERNQAIGRSRLGMESERKEEMKASRYNVFAPSPDGDGDELVYNALTGAILRGDRNFIRVLREGDVWSLIAGDYDDILFDNGFLVPDTCDELDVYRQLHNRWKSGSELAEFNMLVTYDCNFACPYCYQGRGDTGKRIHGFKAMDEEMIKRFKTFVKRTVEERQSKRMELVLYGGEPLLEEKACRQVTDELARWAAKNNVAFRLHLLSNGSLLTPDFVEWASQYRLRLQVPVDGAEEQHNRIRFYKDRDETCRGSFNDVTTALALTNRPGIETHIRISLTDETYPSMVQMLDSLKERGLTHLYTDFCYITAFTNACAPYGQHILDDGMLFRVMPTLWREAHSRGFRLDIRPHPQPLPCSSIADGSFITDPFGEVYKCWELVGLKEHAVGRLAEDGRLEKTAVYDDVLLRDPTTFPQCASHSYLPSCGGGCVCKAYWQHRTYHAAGCGSEKYLLPEKIKMVFEMAKPLDTQPRMYDNMDMQIVSGPVEPAMSHCYVLV